MMFKIDVENAWMLKILILENWKFWKILIEMKKKCFWLMLKNVIFEHFVILKNFRNFLMMNKWEEFLQLWNLNFWLLKNVWN